jgi:hypothetical protein
VSASIDPASFHGSWVDAAQILAEWQDAKIIPKPFHRRMILIVVADTLETVSGLSGRHTREAAWHSDVLIRK